ncbi:GDSL-type esterase/lipase family protein [Thermoclostridium stercorarium]|uniref:GDSL-type esterase/lipase family protein n=1 Tax=Thermoclostridium stercorarium TaxID=1510 RepID=UPI000B317AD1|nr:GDSL-type esterase/lipase family protein [Thermoclostridium stercorarium]UZQ85548.1 GDSL-type esterase/lipase family protein [Thermoclostridium stercorarium]
MENYENGLPSVNASKKVCGMISRFIDAVTSLYKKQVDNAFVELNKSAKPGSIVFVGDSITDFFRLNEFFHGAYVINRGISGDTTDGVLKRLNESVFELQPSKVFLLIGTNDIGGNKSDGHIVRNIGEIIDRIREKCPETRIYLQSIYPVSKAGHKKIRKYIVGKRNNEKIRRINEALKEMAKQKGVEYIDVYSHLIDEEGNLRLEYTVEGLHLTVEGYRVCAEVLRPYVFGIK